MNIDIDNMTEDEIDWLTHELLPTIRKYGEYKLDGLSKEKLDLYKKIFGVTDEEIKKDESNKKKKSKSNDDQQNGGNKYIYSQYLESKIKYLHLHNKI